MRNGPILKRSSAGPRRASSAASSCYRRANVSRCISRSAALNHVCLLRRCDAAMNTFRSIVAGATLLALPAEAQVPRFETDPVVTVRENFVACDVLSRAICVYLSAGHDHAVQMDTPESVVQIISPYVSGRAQGGRGLGKWLKTACQIAPD